MPFLIAGVAVLQRQSGRSDRTPPGRTREIDATPVGADGFTWPGYWPSERCPGTAAAMASIAVICVDDADKARSALGAQVVQEGDLTS